MSDKKKRVGGLVGHPPDGRSFVKSSATASDCLVGVEVEIEGVDVDVQPRRGTPFGKYWELVHDGSLRDGGVEFVLRNPLSGKDLVDSLIELERKIEQEEWKPKLSDRTSVHVHLDVREMTVEELQNLVILYTIFEKPLFNYAGPDRKDNIFCTSFEDTQGIVELISRQFNAGDGMFHMRLGDFQKYSSCNLLAVAEHGSLEFRNHAGEFRAAKLLRWVNILLSMHKYAKMRRIIPANLPSEISQMGIEKFTAMVFGKYAKHLQSPTLVNDVMDGVRLAQDLIHFDKMEYEGYWEEEPSLFTKYMKKLGKEAPKPNKIGIDEDWAHIVFDGHAMKGGAF